MPYTHPYSIAGKYFIFGALASFGNPNGGPLLHGRILGPIESEISHFYLCEIYPTSKDLIAVGSQIIFALEQLVGTYLYDDRAIFDAEWADLLRRVQIMQRMTAVQVHTDPPVQQGRKRRSPIVPRPAEDDDNDQ